MCPVVETQLAETQFAESEVQFAEFFRQTGQSRDNLPNSANWVSANCPKFRGICPICRNPACRNPICRIRGTVCRVFFDKLGKVGTICRIRLTGFQQTVLYSVPGVAGVTLYPFFVWPFFLLAICTFVSIGGCL